MNSAAQTISSTEAINSINDSPIEDYSAFEEEKIIRLDYNITRFRTVDDEHVDLENYVYFNNQLFPNRSTYTGKLIDRLSKEIGNRLQFEGYKIKLKYAALCNILTNLLYAHDKGACLAMSFRNEGFKPSNSDTAPHHTYSIFEQVFDKLDEHGYIEIKKGFYYGNNSKISRVIPTRKLLNEFCDLNESQTTRQSHEDVVYIRAGNNDFSVREVPFSSPNEQNLIRFNCRSEDKVEPSTETIEQLSQEIRHYNDFISTCSVLIPENIFRRSKAFANCRYEPLSSLLNRRVENTLIDDSTRPSTLSTTASCEEASSECGTGGNAKKVFKIVDYYPSSMASNTSKAPLISITGLNCPNDNIYMQLNPRVYRVFNSYSFDYGGRLYGSDVLTLNCDLRKHILLNGQAVTELDYKSLHISILYAEMGEEIPADDPYELYGGNKLLREAVKGMINIAINAEHRISALMAFNKKFTYDSSSTENTAVYNELYRYDLTANQILEDIIEHHKTIAPFIHSGKGLELQSIDSKIAVDILKHFTTRNIPCLPIHDSFIVPIEHRDELMEAMRAMYKKHTGHSCRIDVKY